MGDDLVHDVNWAPAPDSCDDQDGQEDAVAESERQEADVVMGDFDDVHFVVDSMAGDTEVPDSHVAVDVKADDISYWCDCCSRVHGDEWWCSCKGLCSCCGLVHRDYMSTSWIYGLDEFNCEVLLPDLEAVEMDGDTIVLPWKERKMGDGVIKLATVDKQASCNAV
ncbi:hypothetical protein E2562_004578 [Oryza meyeriana var. granulata]|uniref:Uncharacterized protein n=1 Tax=Oryza meyeriana var. granulata TaxID=110450 RepID=A0A6G1F3K1_9ORYZ|nr:hypothetical protein E2562_004578 [Oryza meyeriana var. granulata]